jgi:hypothetical protein
MADSPSPTRRSQPSGVQRAFSEPHRSRHGFDQASTPIYAQEANREEIPGPAPHDLRSVERLLRQAIATTALAALVFSQ